MKKNGNKSDVKQEEDNLSNNEAQVNGGNEETDELTEEQKEEMFKQLNILNISLIGIFIIIYGILLSLDFILWQRSQVLDGINKTNYSEGLADLSDNPKKTNILYLLGICIFTFVIWDNYITSAAQTGEARSEKTIKNNYRSLIAILLILLATTINHDTLNL